MRSSAAPSSLHPALAELVRILAEAAVREALAEDKAANENRAVASDQPKAAAGAA